MGKHRREMGKFPGMALSLPNPSRELSFVRISIKQEKLNARSTQRNIGRRGSVEVWRRMYFDDPDLYYRVLVTRLRALLMLGWSPTDHQLLCFLPNRKISSN